MKKIAIMGSADSSLFDAIVNYFKDKDVDIICLSDNLNSDILKSAENLGINHKYLPFEENAEYFATNDFSLIVLAGYTNLLPPEVLDCGKFINIHPSLLPAFKGKDALQRAFYAGVKVSGVTVHWVTSDIDGGKIIAQYPVMIGSLTHFDEFESEIHELEQLLYPIVIETILEDKVFDYQDLLKSSCSGGSCGKNCGGCGGCH